jgi:hypothetical protein
MDQCQSCQEVWHPHTFANYAHDDLSKRVEIGVKVGRPSNEYIVKTLVRADRANVGWTSKETANNLVRSIIL